MFSLQMGQWCYRKPWRSTISENLIFTIMLKKRLQRTICRNKQSPHLKNYVLIVSWFYFCCVFVYQWEMDSARCIVKCTDKTNLYCCDRSPYDFWPSDHQRLRRQHNITWECCNDYRVLLHFFNVSSSNAKSGGKRDRNSSSYTKTTLFHCINNINKSS